MIHSWTTYTQTKFQKKRTPRPHLIVREARVSQQHLPPKRQAEHCWSVHRLVVCPTKGVKRIDKADTRTRRRPTTLTLMQQTFKLHNFQHYYFFRSPRSVFLNWKQWEYGIRNSKSKSHHFGFWFGRYLYTDLACCTENTVPQSKMTIFFIGKNTGLRYLYSKIPNEIFWILKNGIHTPKSSTRFFWIQVWQKYTQTALFPHFLQVFPYIKLIFTENFYPCLVHFVCFRCITL